MMSRNRIKVGDWVHFPEDPKDIGVIIKHCRVPRSPFSLKTRPEERLIVRWLRSESPDVKEVDEINRGGRLLTLDSGFVERLSEPLQRRYSKAYRHLMEKT